MRPHVTRDCAYCGKSFTLRPYVTKTRYCGRKCSAVDRYLPYAERFWSKVDRLSLAGCWPWLAGCFKSADGFEYGAFCVGESKNRGAHLVAWELENGRPFPEGKQGNHSCDFTLCCRPDHVIPGTQDDNMKQMAERGRSRRGDRHPGRLHPETRPRGERVYNAKLTDDLVRRIKIRWAELGPGYGHQTTIAREIGIPVGAINRIVHDHSWRHVA